jgi:hypothetical protein
MPLEKVADGPAFRPGHQLTGYGRPGSSQGHKYPCPLRLRKAKSEAIAFSAVNLLKD